MKASENLIKKVKEFEGCPLKAYKDPVGIWTIGCGHIRGVRAGMVITQQQADTLLKGDLLPCENYVNGLGMIFTQCQFDALCDFCFNLGSGALASSTLLKKIKAKAPTAEIQTEFRKWVYAKGRKLPGLIKRREWEAQQWAT